MGLTPKYKFPWPEPANVADGPDGYRDLAVAVEASLAGVQGKITPLNTFQSSSVLAPPSAAMKLNAVSSVTAVNTVAAKAWARVVDINCTVHCSAGAIGINLFVNNVLVRICHKNDTGTHNLIHQLSLSANSSMTFQVQVQALLINTRWTNDSRYTRVQLISSPI